jgi:RNA polymerase sigma-70 factor (ECF subfamily)
MPAIVAERHGMTRGAARTGAHRRAYTAAMPGDAAEDVVLVERLSSDEPGEALRALFRQYGGELYGFALQLTGDAGAAARVVEEVFLRAWHDAPRYDPEREPVRAWLYELARTAIGADDPAAERARLGWQVAAALARLAPEHRQIIRLVLFRGLTMREVAADTGLPVSTVKRRTWYALRSLRLVLEEMGPAV